MVEYPPTGGPSSFANVPGATGLAFDSSGNLYVGDAFNNTIVKVTPNGTSSVFASLNFTPYDLTFDSSGNLYVANYSSGSIEKITTGGAQSVFATGLEGPSGLAFGFSPSGDLLVANYSGHLYRGNYTGRGGFDICHRVRSPVASGV